MKTNDLDFPLPPDLIAQVPLPDRSASRLLRYHRESRQIGHRTFADLPSLLRPGDLLVFNDARVIPARFMLRKSTGGRVEGLFLAQNHPAQWHVLLRNAGGIALGARLSFESDPRTLAAILQSLGQGEFILGIEPPIAAAEMLESVGRMPLPPYIHRDRIVDPRDDLDRQRYQTIYASAPGAVAAPTAGLHFTPELLRQLDERAIQRISVTLHVGVGTFRPITADTLDAHSMHGEAYTITASAAAALSQAKEQGRRIIAVGTTSARVLESQPPGASFAEATSETSIFIYPPYRWKHVDALITNFHLPRGTLIALVAAMTGLDEQRRIYAEAIARRYRFFSYGDAMLIE